MGNTHGAAYLKAMKKLRGVADFAIKPIFRSYTLGISLK
jgi:hypothetical protein